jgi:hypothetical protein
MTEYICAICGTKYKDLEERINCEIECLAQRKADEEKRKKLELEQAKEARLSEIENAYKCYKELYAKFVKDYEEYPITTFKYGDNCPNNFSHFITW